MKFTVVIKAEYFYIQYKLIMIYSMLIVLALLYSQSFCEAADEIIIVNQQDQLVNYAPIICQKHN